MPGYEGINAGVRGYKCQDTRAGVRGYQIRGTRDIRYEEGRMHKVLRGSHTQGMKRVACTRY